MFGHDVDLVAAAACDRAQGLYPSRLDPDGCSLRVHLDAGTEWVGVLLVLAVIVVVLLTASFVAQLARR